LKLLTYHDWSSHGDKHNVRLMLVAQLGERSGQEDDRHIDPGEPALERLKNHQKADSEGRGVKLRAVLNPPV